MTERALQSAQGEGRGVTCDHKSIGDAPKKGMRIATCDCGAIFFGHDKLWTETAVKVQPKASDDDVFGAILKHMFRQQPGKISVLK